MDLTPSATKEKRLLEKHHISPSKVVLIPREEHMKIHGILPIRNELSKEARIYDALNRFIINLKVWRTNFEKDFGTKNLFDAINILEQEKHRFENILKKKTKEDSERFKDIKGIGGTYLARLLAYAHPNRFPSLRKFLHYCGFKESSSVLQTYNHKVKPIVHAMTVQVIRKKDKKYYPLYLEIKRSLKERHPGHPKAEIDGKAINRLSTLILKEIYRRYRG
jgi:hypothetical protein